MYQWAKVTNSGFLKGDSYIKKFLRVFISVIINTIPFNKLFLLRKKKKLKRTNLQRLIINLYSEWKIKSFVEMFRITNMANYICYSFELLLIRLTIVALKYCVCMVYNKVLSTKVFLWCNYGTIDDYFFFSFSPFDVNNFHPSLIYSIYYY